MPWPSLFLMGILVSPFAFGKKQTVPLVCQFELIHSRYQEGVIVTEKETYMETWTLKIAGLGTTYLISPRAQVQVHGLSLDSKDRGFPHGLLLYEEQLGKLLGVDLSSQTSPPHEEPVTKPFLFLLINDPNRQTFEFNVSPERSYQVIIGFQR